MAPRATRAALQSLQAACRECHLCVYAGIIPEANPTFAGEWGAPFFLVGQAPGPAERESRRPFSGRAGKELDRWMLRAGFSTAEEFRRLTYIAALMRCFPGRNRAGTGDLRPPPAAVSIGPEPLAERPRQPRPTRESAGDAVEAARGGASLTAFSPQRNGRDE